MSSDFPFELAAFARKSDPETSKQAADVSSRVSWEDHAIKILAALSQRPMNAEEAIVAADLTHAKSPWRRITTLIKRGWACDTGEVRKSSCNKWQRVCAITPQGRAVLSGLTH